jgi:PE-PPE domain
LGKHRKPAQKKWGPYVTTSVALEVATLFAFAYATDSHVPGASLLAQTSIFVDGTKSILGNEEGVPFYRMADSFQGAYSGADYDEKLVIYPRSLGPLTGMGDPTYDDSEAEATRGIVSAVEAAKNDPAYNGEKVYVVGYSQGAGAGANAIPILEERGLNDNVVFVLASNPRRNDGGILTRLPAGVYVPIFGVSFGGGTTAEETKVLQVTKQYDGVADSPDYVFNVVADANAILGYYYLHSGYYKDVPAVPEDIDPNDPPDGMIVSTNENGNVTDVVLVAPEGQLPLTMPLLQLGVPEDVVIALDPFLRAVIETGYDRPEGEGAYPDEPVPFRLVPPPDQWLANAQAVSAGAAETAQRLSALDQPTMPDVETAGADARLPQGSPEPLVGQLPGPTDAQPPTPPSDVEDRATLRPLSPLRDAFGIGTGPNKVEPPKRPASGWKPGDLVRSVLNPQSSTAAGSNAPDPLGAVRNALSSLSDPPGSKPNPDTDGSTTSSATGSSSPSE